MLGPVSLRLVSSHAQRTDSQPVSCLPRLLLFHSGGSGRISPVRSAGRGYFPWMRCWDRAGTTGPEARQALLRSKDSTKGEEWNAWPPSAVSTLRQHWESACCCGRMLAPVLDLILEVFPKLNDCTCLGSETENWQSLGPEGPLFVMFSRPWVHELSRNSASFSCLLSIAEFKSMFLGKVWLTAQQSICFDSSALNKRSRTCRVVSHSLCSKLSRV